MNKNLRRLLDECHISEEELGTPIRVYIEPERFLKFFDKYTTYVNEGYTKLSRKIEGVLIECIIKEGEKNEQ